MSFCKDKHCRVPVFSSQNCENEDKSIEEVSKINSLPIAILGCFLSEKLHSQQNIDEHQEEEKYREH
jgi:hypothetical protein